MNPTLNFRFHNEYTSRPLFNFPARRFAFESIEFCSTEGVLQSLKFDDRASHKTARALFGKKAKLAKTDRSNAWQAAKSLWGKRTPPSQQSYELSLLAKAADLSMPSQKTDFEHALADSAGLDSNTPSDRTIRGQLA